MNLKRTMRAGFTGITFPAAPLLAGFILAAGFTSSVQAAFEDLGAGARGPGMGNAMAAVSEDVYSAHYNPAGLGVMTRPQFTAAYTQLFMGLTDGSKLGTSFFGYAHPLKDGKSGTLAGALNSFSLDGSLYRENTAYLSYGRLAHTASGGNELFLGTTLKYLYSSFGSFSESSNATDGIISTGRADPVLSGGSGHKAFDADAGALYRFGTHYQLGFQAAHLMRPDMAFSSGDFDPLPLTLKLGFNYKSLISNLAVQGETKKAPDGGTDNFFTAAAERWFPRVFIGDFGVRGAMGIGSREYKQLSLGLSYRNRRVQVDYGYALPLAGITGTSGSHRMAITFHFGKPTEQEETLEMLMETMRGLKSGTAGKVEKSTVTVFVVPEPSGTERAIAEKLAASEEAIKGERYREAVSLASTVVELAPKNVSAWQNMGIAYLGMEKYASSLRAWEKAYEYETRPALRKAIRGYMNSITRLERLKPVKRTPRAAPKSALSEAEIEGLLNRGVDHYVKREFAKSREMFEKVLNAAPDNVEALKALRRLNDEKRF